MKRFTVVICALYAIFSAVVFAEDLMSVSVVTNLHIESETTTNLLGWTRQAVMGDGKGGIIDKSGQIVSAAEAAAQRSAATNIQDISTAALGAVTNAVAQLWNVTNQIPTNATHVGLYFPRSTPPKNLTGLVIEEGTDGVTDWQIVEYSHYLSIAPNRHVRYTYQGTTSIVECVWDAWNPSSLVHRCTFTRPPTARGKRVRYFKHETIGGDNGFDFGSALVTVDGTPTFTGEWTNALDGTIHTFRNGVKIKTVKESANE